ncbi:MAG: hypothetical protein ACRCZB_09740 [Bacteroidales bacterium]
MEKQDQGEQIPAKTQVKTSVSVNNKILEQVARRALAVNNTLKEVWVSADGRIFGNAVDAQQHAKSLSSKIVVHQKR